MNRNAEQFVRSGQRPFWKVPLTFWFFFLPKVHVPHNYLYAYDSCYRCWPMGL